jgi:hypothetical protein
MGPSAAKVTVAVLRMCLGLRGAELGDLCGLTQHDSRVEQARRIEGRLDRAHRAYVVTAAGVQEPARLRDADAVFGADRAAAGEHETQDGVIDVLVVGFCTEDVDVQVAVAQVPPQDRLRAGGYAVDDAGELVQEAGKCGERDTDVELVRRPGGGDGVGVSFAQRPEALA